MFTRRRPASPLPPYTRALCGPTSYMHCSPLKSSTLTLASIAGWRTGPDAGTRSPDSGLGGRCQHKGTKPNNNYSPQRPPPLKVLGAYKKLLLLKRGSWPKLRGPWSLGCASLPQPRRREGVCYDIFLNKSPCDMIF